MNSEPSARGHHGGRVVGEQAASELVVAVGGTIDRDVRVLAAFAAIMDRTRDDRAPRPVVAEDPGGCIAAGDQAHAAQQLADLRAITGEQRLVGHEVDRLAELLAIEHVGELVDDREQAIEIDRPRQLFDDIGVSRAPTGSDEHELDAGRCRGERLDQIRARGELGVGDDQIGCRELGVPGIAADDRDPMAAQRECALDPGHCPWRLGEHQRDSHYRPPTNTECYRYFPW